MMYYRFTNKNTPMSDWGHAMFAEDRDQVVFYGQNEYILDSSDTTSIYSLEDAVKSAWAHCVEDEYFGDFYIDLTAAQEMSADEVFDMFCPTNIVNSAWGYDSDWVVWLWQFVLEPRSIMAVRTQDGAVCFDQDLIIEAIAA